MKKMTMKLMSVVLTGAMSAVALTGCSSQTSTNTSAGNTTSSTNTESKKEESKPGQVQKVTVWTENRHDAEFMQQVVADFNKEYAGEIEVEYITHTDNYINMITMAAASNQAPDVFNMGFGKADLKAFVDAGIIQPINTFMSDQFKETTQIETTKLENLNTLGDDIYFGYPTKRSGFRLIYNKELFDKAGITETPKTLDEFVDFTKKLTEVGEGTKYGIGFPGLSNPVERLLTPIAQVSGVLPYDYENGKFDFSGYKPIVEAMKQMFANDSVLPGSTSLKIDPLRVQFSEGNVGVYANASQEVGVLTEQFPAKMEWGVAPVPSIDGEIKGTLTATPNNGWALSKGSKNPEAAWKFVEYVTQPEKIVAYVEGGYALPMSADLMDQVDQSKISKLAEFGVLDYEGIYPAMPNVTIQGTDYETALWEACIPGGKNIDETIAALNKDYNDALDRDVKMGKVKRVVIKGFDPMNPSAGEVSYLSE